MSLSPSRKPDGSEAASVWLSSTRIVPPSSPTGTGRVEPTVLDAQLVEHPQGRAGEEAQLGVVAFALELGDHHDRQDDFVLGEPFQGAGVGQQDAGVEDIGAVLRSAGRPLSDYPSRTGANALTRSSSVHGPDGSVKRCVTSQDGLRFSGLPHPPMWKKYARTDPFRSDTPERGVNSMFRSYGDERAETTRGSGPEAALALGVRTDGPQEVDAAEVGPERLAEVELRVGALPEQEAAEPLLARGADHEVGVGLALGVEVIGDVLDVDHVGELIERRAAGGVLLEQRANGVGDLAATAITDRDVDQDAVDVAGLVLGGLELLGGARRQQVERADRVDAATCAGRRATRPRPR